jgi:hypothetical protein
MEIQHPIILTAQGVCTQFHSEDNVKYLVDYFYKRLPRRMETELFLHDLPEIIERYQPNPGVSAFPSSFCGSRAGWQMTPSESFGLQRCVDDEQYEDMTPTRFWDQVKLANFEFVTFATMSYKNGLSSEREKVQQAQQNELDTFGVHFATPRKAGKVVMPLGNFIRTASNKPINQRNGRQWQLGLEQLCQQTAHERFEDDFHVPEPCEQLFRPRPAREIRYRGVSEPAAVPDKMPQLPLYLSTHTRGLFPMTDSISMFQI